MTQSSVNALTIIFTSNIYRLKLMPLLSPLQVSLPGPAVQINARDSHSTVLAEEGRFSCGDSSGPIGLVEWGEMEPGLVKVEEDVVKIISGGDQLVMLTSYRDQGQL